MAIWLKQGMLLQLFSNFPTLEVVYYEIALCTIRLRPLTALLCRGNVIFIAYVCVVVIAPGKPWIKGEELT